MKLEDLKPSLLQLTKEEQLAIHREIRKSRLTPIAKKKVSTAKQKKRSKDSKAMSAIKNDITQLEQLLALVKSKRGKQNGKT